MIIVGLLVAFLGFLVGFALGASAAAKVVSMTTMPPHSAAALIVIGACVGASLSLFAGASIIARQR